MAVDSDAIGQLEASKAEDSPETRSAFDVLDFPLLAHAPGSIGYIEKLFIGQLLTISRPKLVIETGTYHGLTTRFLAEFLERNGAENWRVVSFDLESVHAELTMTAPDIVANPNITLVSGYLPGSLSRFLEADDSPIDFAIIDAMHDYRSVTRELQQIYPRLQEGAYIFCHDYREHDPSFHGVVAAIDRFAEDVGCDLLPLNPADHEGESIVWGTALLRKPAGSRSRIRNEWIAARSAWQAIAVLPRKVLRRLMRGVG